MQFKTTAILNTLLTAILTISLTHAAEKTSLKLLTFNILYGGNSRQEIGATSPLYNINRHDHVAAAIIQSGADIVGVLEPNSSNPDPILALLQADDPAWKKRNNLYAKFPIEADPRNPGDTSTHLVRTGSEQFVICHVAHWKPTRGYGPDIVQNRIIAGDIPADPDQFDAEIVAAMRIDNTYQATLAKVQPHINAGRPVFVLGDFNECSHLDWTADYAARGMDRWVANPTSTPLRFKITWPGSSLLLGAGLKDAFREIFPDPVAKPGTTWTPPYANNTPGRRPYDGNNDPNNGSQNQIATRIDWLLFAGNGVTPTSAGVFGENPANPEHENKSEIIPDVQYNGPWPSDHRGVLATFTLPSVTGPEIPATLPTSVPTRDSADFSSSLDQIEGDVNPANLGTWTQVGSPAITVNGDGTFQMTIPDDSVAGDQAFRANGDYVNPTVGWTWETRFRIDSSVQANKPVWEIFIRDNSPGSLAATRIHFLSTGVDRDTSNYGTDAEVSKDLSDDFHVIRGMVEGGTNNTTVWLDGNKVIDSLVSQSYNASELLVFGNWSGNNEGGTTTIDYLRFDTTGAYAPLGDNSASPPPSPANGASIGRCQPLYWWPVTGAAGYKVWFGTSPTFTSRDFQGEFGSNYFDPGQLLENQTYYWRIDPVFSNGGTVTGSTWSFTSTTGSDLTPQDSYQGWKLQQFSTAELLDPALEPTLWGDEADPDKDGIPTILECALGGNPFAADNDLLPYVIDNTNSSSFVYRQRSGAVGAHGNNSTSWNLSYQVQLSYDLQTWHSGPPYVTADTSPASNGDGTDNVTVELTINDASPYFARLLVTETSP